MGKGERGGEGGGGVGRCDQSEDGWPSLEVTSAFEVYSYDETAVSSSVESWSVYENRCCSKVHRSPLCRVGWLYEEGKLPSIVRGACVDVGSTRPPPPPPPSPPQHTHTMWQQ